MSALLLTMLLQVPTTQPACPYLTWEWNTQGGLGYQPQTFAEDYVYDWLTLYSDVGAPVKVKWPSAGKVYTHPDGLNAYLVCFTPISNVKDEYCAYFETDWWNCDREQPTTTTTSTTTTTTNQTPTTAGAPPTTSTTTAPPPTTTTLPRFTDSGPRWALSRFLEIV